MTKNELIKTVQGRFRIYPAKDIAVACNSLFEMMTDALKRGGTDRNQRIRRLFRSQQEGKDGKESAERPACAGTSAEGSFFQNGPGGQERIIES